MYGPGSKIINKIENDNNSGTKIIHGPLPYVMAVFWNQNQSNIFADLSVRQALTLAIPREKIVKDILGDYGVVATTPLPATYFQPVDKPFAFADKFAKTGSSTSDLILEKSGWKRNADGIYEKKGPKDRESTVLEFSLTTSSTNPEFKAIAEAIAAAWNEAGAKVDLKVYDSDLGQNIIRPRKFDALLFGEVIGPDLDLYGFWHSSQRLSPGLNIAQYTNSKADKILEEARSISDEKSRISKYREFEELVLADVPAGFVYSPDFVYLMPTKVRGTNIQSLTTPSDRLSSVEDWYINTDHVWKIFSTRINR
jgi:peptide/nickel transport system substrate-binding protein